MSELKIEPAKSGKVINDSQVRDPGIPKNAFLVINNQVVPIIRRETRIGRKLDNDLVIQDVLVSREHAKVVYEEGQFVAYDLESTGGTFINNKKISKGVLYNGDGLSLSSVTVKFVHDAPRMKNQADRRTGSLPKN